MYMRDWKTEAENIGLVLIEKQKDTLICKKDDFIFKFHRSNWPPSTISPRACTEPTEYFKYLITKVHRDTYDLTQTVFISADSKIKAECKTHGLFSIRAANFMAGKGCPTCGKERIGVNSRLDQEDFLKRVLNIYGDKYNYSETKYISCKSKIKVICNIHGEFQIIAGNHLEGKGCWRCGVAESRQKRKLNKTEVINRFKKVHGDRYDYSLVDYKDAHSLLNISCKDHGLFLQSYANHNSGKGCPICAREFNPRLKKGFILSAESKNYASLYLIQCKGNGENFYKIGITTKDLKRRFGGSSQLPYKYDLKHLVTSTNGEFIWDLETKLHKKYKEQKYIPKQNFGGMFECFTQIDTQEFITYISSLSVST